MIDTFDNVRAMPAVQETLGECVARGLKEVLDAKGDRRGKLLMAPRILADLSKKLKESLCDNSFTRHHQLVMNMAGEIDRYTGAVCVRQADKFLLELEKKSGLVTSERESRHKVGAKVLGL